MTTYEENSAKRIRQLSKQRDALIDALKDARSALGITDTFAPIGLADLAKKIDDALWASMEDQT